MEIAVVVQDLDVNNPHDQAHGYPWIFHRDRLVKDNVKLHIFEQPHEGVFDRPWDAMMLLVWQDWNNQKLFKPDHIMPLMARFATYRAKYPKVTQIACNHTDMCRSPFVTPYWRYGDPILYRTPAKNPTELAPLPAEHIWPFEIIWGSPCFNQETTSRYKAGFIGGPNGAFGYRKKVAEQVNKVGFGRCSDNPMSSDQYRKIMSGCEIIVCPTGWGETSSRHWDAWFSKKPVLIDTGSAAVDMIPSVDLKENVHYLLYHQPEHIPDIVSDWTKPSRKDDLAQIAQNGYDAAMRYDSYNMILYFLQKFIYGRIS